MAYITPIAYPIVSVTPSTGVNITMINDSIDYETFIGSLKDVSYKVKYIYFECDDLNQLSQHYQFNRVTPGGQNLVNNTNPNPTPYQFQPTYYYDAADDDFIINNLNTLTFNMLPFESLKLFFFCDSASYEYLEYPDDDLPSQAQEAMAVLAATSKLKVKSGESIANAVLVVSGGIVVGFLIAKLITGNK